MKRIIVAFAFLLTAFTALPGFSQVNVVVQAGIRPRPWVPVYRPVVVYQPVVPVYYRVPRRQVVIIERPAYGHRRWRRW